MGGKVGLAPPPAGVLIAPSEAGSTVPVTEKAGAVNGEAAPPVVVVVFGVVRRVLSSVVDESADERRFLVWRTV